ncbi:hypothetical protein QJS10_CPA03g00265 [Acorus calamus]|uniref:RRM domain-containing protein n=1 Tax=Acorus calamus TaxID=4465 RepID=A0AAV9F5N0_ACOCL|nr:hypothetical protein QJS10_CPA03g00265 [Acorus calamus]
MRPSFHHRPHGLKLLYSQKHEKLYRRIWEPDLDRCIKTIFVSYIPIGTLEKDLKNFYGKYGPIVRIDLQPGKMQWMFAFVESEEPSAAQQARDLSDGTFIQDGHVIKANDETVKSCIPETPYEHPLFTFASSNSSIGGVMASHDVVHYAFDSLPYCAEILMFEFRGGIVGGGHNKVKRDQRTHRERGGGACFRRGGSAPTDPLLQHADSGCEPAGLRRATAAASHVGFGGE